MKTQGRSQRRLDLPPPHISTHVCVLYFDILVCVCALIMSRASL